MGVPPGVNHSLLASEYSTLSREFFKFQSLVYSESSFESGFRHYKSVVIPILLFQIISSSRDLELVWTRRRWRRRNLWEEQEEPRFFWHFWGVESSVPICCVQVQAKRQHLPSNDIVFSRQRLLSDSRHASFLCPPHFLEGFLQEAFKCLMPEILLVRDIQGNIYGSMMINILLLFLLSKSSTAHYSLPNNEVSGYLESLLRSRLLLLLLLSPCVSLPHSFSQGLTVVSSLSEVTKCSPPPLHGFVYSGSPS